MADESESKREREGEKKQSLITSPTIGLQESCCITSRQKEINSYCCGWDRTILGEMARALLEWQSERQTTSGWAKGETKNFHRWHRLAIIPNRLSSAFRMVSDRTSLLQRTHRVFHISFSLPNTIWFRFSWRLQLGLMRIYPAGSVLCLDMYHVSIFPHGLSQSRSPISRLKRVPLPSD